MNNEFGLFTFLKNEADFKAYDKEKGHGYASDKPSSYPCFAYTDYGIDGIDPSHLILSASDVAAMHAACVQLADEAKEAGK